ncbi:GNAT family N-acetyltransferase [Aporhodopirellula aestuarii]|uniref:GNAT family N-acetyltransferase n=1 Tax=Aporhodopirellula aestuarii TaxID=2950107 RepID=A0ABT0UDJ9_9BACT|nr:GNAT family N-acetyltransferase [Aporhodopirellula aestuarii]MCM2375132.1 GNAT family N-acetyltransferase [Aporhodopirellula aestuarii]
MLELRKIQSDLFPKLYDSFLIDDDPLSNEQDWRNVFDYPWPNEEGHCGYAMLRDDELVGMMGMVFSDRSIQGQSRKFCNLHTWWVREDQRGHSLMMLRPLKKLSERYTITHFTPCDRIRAVARKLGFRDLSSQLRILLPIGQSTAARKSKSQVEFIWEPEQIRPALCEAERRIFDDHQPYSIGHLLIQDDQTQCYVVYTHVVRHRLPYCHIHYIGDRGLFAKCEPMIRATLIARHQVRFVAMEQRHCDGLQLHRSLKFWSPASSLVKSDTVNDADIDGLYSDVVFLKLTTLPDITHHLRQRAADLLPFLTRPD